MREGSLDALLSKQVDVTVMAEVNEQLTDHHTTPSSSLYVTGRDMSEFFPDVVKNVVVRAVEVRYVTSWVPPR